MGNPKYRWSLNAESLDLVGQSLGPRNVVNPDVYYQHFYSGSDAFFYIVDRTGRLIPIPIVSFAYGVSQEKVPVFGAWDYTFRGVARGTRIVRGEFSILFTEPNYLGQLLGMEDQPDDTDASSPLRVVATSSEVANRDQLRSDIWGVTPDGTVNVHNSVDDSVSVYNPEQVNGRHAAYPFGRSNYRMQPGMSAARYAGHSAFDILVSHGNNPDYSFGDPTAFNRERWSASVYDHLKYVANGFNEVTGTDLRRSERVYIETVELMSSGIAYDTSGQPLLESYSFIARDVTTPHG
jgi:hypothetical protein